MEFIALVLLLAAITWAAWVLPRINALVFGLCVIVVGAVFGSEFFSVKVGPLPVTIDRVLWAVFCGIVVWIRLFRHQGSLFRVTPIDFVLGSFLAIMIVSTFTHDWQRSDNLPLGRLLFFQLIPASFFWLGRNVSFGTRELRSFAVVGIIFGLYLALTGVAERFGWHQLIMPRYIIDNANYEFFGRARGPFINPIGNGIVQIFCLGCCAQAWRMATENMKILLSIAMAILLVGIFCTMTRSVWIALCVSAAITIWFSCPRVTRGGLITASAVGGILLIFFVAPMMNSFKRDRYVSAEAMSRSLSLRPKLFAVACEMSSEKPFFGHGYGQYKKISAPYHRTDRWDQELQTVQQYLQHNVFLAFLVEVGTIGLGLFVIILSCFIFNAYRLLTDPRLKPDFRMLCLTVLIVNLSIIINGLFHDVSLIVVLGSLFYFINGLTYSIRDRQLEEFQTTNPPAEASPT